MVGFGTWLFTLAKGQLVGQDPDGNKYYAERKTAQGKRQRRWVLFNGEIEASRIPPEWHAWLHHTAQAPLTGVHRHAWQQAHQANHTGTAEAYLPGGHDLAGGTKAVGYQAWHP